MKCMVEVWNLASARTIAERRLGLPRNSVRYDQAAVDISAFHYGQGLPGSDIFDVSDLSAFDL